MNWAIKYTSPLDANYLEYLKKNDSDLLLTYPSLLEGLQYLNETNNPRQVAFIFSKCADKGHICLNCKEKNYTHVLNAVKKIINQHNLHQGRGKSIIKSFK